MSGDDAPQGVPVTFAVATAAWTFTGVPDPADTDTPGSDAE